MNENSDKAQENEPNQGSLLPPPRKFGSKSEYARHRGCAPSAVTRAISEGRITTTRINGRELIDFEQADAQWAVSTRPRRDAHITPPRGPSVDDQTRATRDELREVRLRRERADADRAELRAMIESREVVYRADAELTLQEFAILIREDAINIPSRTAPMLVGRPASEIADVLAEAIADMLNRVADAMSRAASKLDQPEELAVEH